MKLNKLHILLPIITAMLIAVSCRKEKTVNAPEAPYQPTPYLLQYPAFVDSQHVMVVDAPDNALTVEGVALGRKLFYETMLSNNMSMSCNTCHKQENAFADPRQFSLGTDHASGNRNAMALINLAWSKQFFWDGRRSSLEGQAHDPVTNPKEMENSWPVVVQRLQGSSTYPDLFYKAFGSHTIDSVQVTKALAQFERTLISYNSRFDRFYYKSELSAISKQELAGFEVFAGLGRCANCHAGVTMTDHSFRNNGLDAMPADSGLAIVTRNPADFGKFKVPTLRNIALTAPYMHDGRFKTLAEVVDFYSDNLHGSSPNIDSTFHFSPGGFHFTAQQKADLLAFLQTLTDSNFVSNPAYSAAK